MSIKKFIVFVVLCLVVATLVVYPIYTDFKAEMAQRAASQAAHAAQVETYDTLLSRKGDVEELTQQYLLFLKIDKKPAYIEALGNRVSVLYKSMCLAQTEIDAVEAVLKRIVNTIGPFYETKKSCQQHRDSLIQAKMEDVIQKLR